MIPARLLYVIFSVCLLANNADAEKILFMTGFAGKSHTHVFEALAAELAERGHKVTSVTPYPMKNPPGNLRHIDVTHVREFMSNFNIMEIKNQSYVTRMNLMKKVAFDICPEILEMPAVKNLLNDKFDLVFVSMLFNECLLPFAFINEAPLILISPHGLVSSIARSIGNPQPPAYVPHLFLPLPDKTMNFVQRATNAFTYFFLDILRAFYIAPQIEAQIRQYYGSHIPSIVNMESNASLILINSHTSYQGPRPLNPNVIEVGGMHIGHKGNETLPKELRDFMAGAEHGVIYFSMGTIVQPDLLEPAKLQDIVDAFAQLPQRVLWKWNLDELPGKKPKNVMIQKWIPQQAILAHPNLRLFVTQGGLMSTQEAIYYGVPILGLPTMEEQQKNMMLSEDLGFALTLDLDTFSKTTLLEAIDKLTNNKTFRANAQMLRSRMRDQPEHPLQRAVYWTEYVLRHQGAPHLRSAAVHLNWYQRILLDVVAVMAFILLLIVFATCFIIRKCCCRRRESIKLKTN